MKLLILSLLFLACNSPTAKKDDKSAIDSCTTAVRFENAQLAETMIDPNYTGELKNYMGDDKSKIDFIHYFEKGKLVKSVFYYENGKPEEEYEFKCGAIHGLVKRYYENGTLGQVIPYRYGRMEGMAEEFRENGKLSVQILFKADSVISRKIIDTTGYNQ